MADTGKRRPPAISKKDAKSVKQAFTGKKDGSEDEEEPAFVERFKSFIAARRKKLGNR